MKPLSGLALLAITAFACAAPSLRGATSVGADASTPSGLRRRLLPFDCRDGAGQPIPSPELAVVHVRPGNSQDLVFEERPGYDRIVISNHFAEAGTTVFAYLSDDAQHSRLLHEIRFGPAPDAASLVIASSFGIRDAVNDAFTATIGRVTLICRLAAVQ